MDRTPGLVIHNWGERVEEKEPKDVVKELVPSSRGKEICQMLRHIRVELAAANGIAYFPAECYHTGDCAGTCYMCDADMRYINEQLNKIPPEQRVYPRFYGNSGNGGTR